jgi:peroxiredoxin
LVQLAQWRDQFAAIGVQVAAMTYDKRALLAEFHQAEQLGFPLLQDEDTRHVEAYGIKNADYEPGHQGYGIPSPGIIYVQKSGEIALKFAVPGYRERPPMIEVYESVRDQVAGAD